MGFIRGQIVGQIHDNFNQYYENMHVVLYEGIPSSSFEIRRARNRSVAYLTVTLRSDNGYSGGRVV